MDTPIYIHNTLQIPKYLKTGNFVKFLSIKVRISSKSSIYRDQDHLSKQLYMTETNVKKITICQSFFLVSWVSSRLPPPLILV